MNYYNDNGELHRLDGPAAEWHDGTKVWFVDGKRHRLDGPAVEYASGTKEWWVNGKLHRLDGPAVEWAGGIRRWYVNGEWFKEQDFHRAVIMFLLGCDECATQFIIGTLNDRT